MKFGIIKERKNPPDRRVVFYPEEFKQLKDSNYIGKIGMRMMARPNTTELEQIFIEPVWVFRKGTTEYKTLAPSTLESFFDV